MQQRTKYQEKCRLKKGDEVMVMVGKSKGETGKVDRVERKTNRVFVSGLNVYKRHTRPTNMNEQGGILDKVMSIHWSNVQIVDGKGKKPTRIGFKVEGEKKARVAKASGATLN